MSDPTADLVISVDSDTSWYWEGTARHELLAQRCVECRRMWHPPSPVCPHCRSLDWTTEPLPGTGTLHSVAKVHQPGSPHQGVDYLICLVDIDDPSGEGPGVRVAANLRHCELPDALIGSSVELFFEELAGSFRLPQFRPQP